jgi:hypothetical protein
MHYYQFNMRCNEFNKHYIRFPKLPAQTCKPNQLPWRINVSSHKEYNCVYTVSHSLTTVVIILSTATSCRLVDHINAVHLPTAHTRGLSEKRSCLAKYGTWMDMCHILNEQPASAKHRKHSKLCTLPQRTMITINTNFPWRMGLPSRTFQQPFSKLRKLVTRRNMQDHWNAVGIALLLRLSKKQNMFVQSTVSHYYILIRTHSVLYTTVHYRAFTTAIMQTSATTENRLTVTLLRQAFSSCFEIRNSRTQ